MLTCFPQLGCLVLETSAGTPSTSSLELPSLGANIWLGVRVWSSWRLAKVSVHLTCFAGSLEEDGVLSFGCLQGKLVQGHDFSTGFEDSGSCPGGHMKSTQLNLGDVKDAEIISDCSNNDSGLALTSLGLHLTDKSGQRDRLTVGSAHKQTSEHHLVKLGIRSASEETVQLHQESEINILTLRLSPVNPSLC